MAYGTRYASERYSKANQKRKAWLFDSRDWRSSTSLSIFQLGVHDLVKKFPAVDLTSQFACFFIAERHSYISKEDLEKIKREAESLGKRINAFKATLR